MKNTEYKIIVTTTSGETHETLEITEYTHEEMIQMVKRNIETIKWIRVGNSVINNESIESFKVKKSMRKV